MPKTNKVKSMKQEKEGIKTSTANRKTIRKATKKISKRIKTATKGLRGGGGGKSYKSKPSRISMIKKVLAKK